MNFGRFSPTQGILLIAVIGLVLFFGGFFLARTAASASKVEPNQARYQFLQVGDTVAAIDVVTGEAYAIDGNTRAWTLLAPPLPSRESKPAR